jgi:hypothetical protein
VSAVSLTHEDDAMVWQYHSSRVYSSQFLYRVINFKGVTPVFVPLVWKLIVPPTIHSLLWLLSHNKLLTRDNLGKRGKLDVTTYLFYGEEESDKTSTF